MQNRVVLTALLAEAEALRYTPGGLPAITVQLEHQSQQVEAGQPREVSARVKAVAFGVLAEQLAQQALGSCWTFEGFLATPRNGKHPVLHLQAFQQD